MGMTQSTVSEQELDSWLAGFFVKPSIEIRDESSVLTCSGRIKVTSETIENDLAKLVADKPYLEYEGIAKKDGEQVRIKTVLHLWGPLDNYFADNSKPFGDGFYDIEFFE